MLDEVATARNHLAAHHPRLPSPPVAVRHHIPGHSTIVAYYHRPPARQLGHAISECAGREPSACGRLRLVGGRGILSLDCFSNPRRARTLSTLDHPGPPRTPAA